MNVLESLKKKICLRDLAKKFVGHDIFKKKSFWRVAVLLIFVFFCLYNFPYIYGKKTDDSSFYIASRGILSGTNIYDENEFYSLGDEIFGKSVEFWPYLYSPVLAELLVPIAAKSYETFTVVWFILNLILGFACPVLTFCAFKGKENTNLLLRTSLLIFCLMSFPVRHTLTLGQVNLLVYFLIILSVIFYKKDKSFLSSLCLANATLIKSFPLIFLLYFALNKDFSYIKKFILSIFVVILPSMLIYGSNVWITYCQSILDTLQSGTRSPFYLQYFANQTNYSLRPFLVQLFESIGLPLSRTFVVYLAIAIIILFISLFALLKAPKNILFSFSLLSVTYLMISPICWRHHYVLIILPLFYILSLGTIHKPLPSFIAIIAAAIIFYYPIWTGFPFNQLILLSTIVLYMLLLFMPGKGQGLIQNKRIQTAI